MVEKRNTITQVEETTRGTKKGLERSKTKVDGSNEEHIT